MEENKQIELRSEKVRNIIGQVPPVLLRYGISIIGLAFLMVVVIATFIPYRPTVEVTVMVEQDSSGLLIYTGFIPKDVMIKNAEFSAVTINSASELPLPEHLLIEKISDTIYVSPDGAWYVSKLTPEKEVPYNIILEEPITIPAKIILKDISVLKWVMGTIENPY